MATRPAPRCMIGKVYLEGITCPYDNYVPESRLNIYGNFESFPERSGRNASREQLRPRKNPARPARLRRAPSPASTANIRIPAGARGPCSGAGARPGKIPMMTAAHAPEPRRRCLCISTHIVPQTCDKHNTLIPERENNSRLGARLLRGTLGNRPSSGAGRCPVRRTAAALLRPLPRR